MMTSEAIEKIDRLRRAGLYFGPAILASVFANAIYGFNCSGKSVIDGSGVQPPILSFVFLIGGVIVAWRLREPLGRLAALLLVVHQLVLLWGVVGTVRLSPVLTTVTLIAWVLLWTASAAREATARGAIVAGAVFFAVSVLVYGARHYALVLSGNRSVTSERLCAAIHLHSRPDESLQ